MKTPLLIMASSAMGQQQRYSILSNEMIRRLSNTNHEETDTEDVHRIIETFTQQLKSSGYSRGDARETVVCGFLGWRRKIARRIQEGTGFYRGAATTLRTRCKKKIMEKVSWYREKRKGKTTKKMSHRGRGYMEMDTTPREKRCTARVR